MKKPHKHAEIIRAWADGAEIESRVQPVYLGMSQAEAVHEHKWSEDKHPSWSEKREYRVKPELPKSPQTNMTKQELKKAFHDLLGKA